MSHLYLALSELSVVIAPVLAQVEAGTLTSSGPWRPPEWSQPTLTALTVPAARNGETNATAPTIYVFDAILRVEHQRRLHCTEHPIQAGGSAPAASITDHAYLLPARVTLEIGMSDAMAGFSPNAWDDGPSKSISAWQMLTDLQAARTLVKLDTRLDSYSNLVIESLSTTDTRETRHGLKAIVTFTEVFLASATSATSVLGFDMSAVDSDRPQTTDQTPSGIVHALPVPSGLAGQNNITAPAATDLQLGSAPRIPGAGVWSSVSISRLKGLLG